MRILGVIFALWVIVGPGLVWAGPHVFAVLPDRASMAGGAVVTIFGDGFEPPVSVHFGEGEARVLDASFAIVVVEVPAASAAGPAPITVRNVGSAAGTTWDGFEYSEPARIESIAPAAGPVAGGTEIVITGGGLPDLPLVTIGGIPASVVRATPNEIVAVTGPSLSPRHAPVRVIDLGGGTIVIGPEFQYLAGRRRAVGSR